MPVSIPQLLAGAQYQMQSYAKNDPVDNFTTSRPFSQWLMKTKMESVFGNGIFNEKVRVTNSSNYQNYTGNDPINFNVKDTVKLAQYAHYEAGDHFTLNETDLANNGIAVTDDPSAQMTAAEEVQVVNLLKENIGSMKDAIQEGLDRDLHLDGSITNKVVGLDKLVSLTPATGAVGGIDPATVPIWKNYVKTSISTATAGTLVSEFEKAFRACSTNGGAIPDAIFVGSSMLDAFRTDAEAIRSVQVQQGQGGKGVSLDAGVSMLSFRGIPVIWDPVFDALDVLYSPATPWAKRAYFLNSKHLKLRPVKGRWMQVRKPMRLPDRYAWYFGMTADFGLTMSKRNSHGVIALA